MKVFTDCFKSYLLNLLNLLSKFIFFKSDIPSFRKVYIVLGSINKHKKVKCFLIDYFLLLSGLLSVMFKEINLSNLTRWHEHEGDF